jgi:hypothetical protein
MVTIHWFMLVVLFIAGNISGVFLLFMLARYVMNNSTGFTRHVQDEDDKLDYSSKRK